jgi:DNA primase catalytic core
MNQPHPDFAEIKKTTDIARVVESYGIELKPSSRGDLKGLCPFHDDTKPSLVVTPAKGLFHCMACGAAGNVIQFVAKKEGIEEREAALRLLDAVPGVSRGSDMTAEGKNTEVDPLADTELFAAILDHYHETLFGKNKNGLNYLKRRNLTATEALQHFKIGFVDGTLKEKLSAAQLEKAKLLGLINAKGNEKFYNRIVVPIFECEPHGRSNGHAVGLYGRDITGKSEVKHLYLAGGHRAVWNAQAASVYPDELICAESLFDALAIWMHGGKRNVIAAYGARGFTPHHTQLLEKSATKKLVFAFDADETGQERARELATELTEKLNLTCHRIKWPEHAKDGNDYFLHNAETDFKGSAESFASLLAVAPRIGFKKDGSAKLTLLEQTEEAALFQNGTVNYKVRGGMGGVGNMKVIVTATAQEKTHTDRLDLYASRSRKAFSATAAWRLELDAQKVEAHLLELLDQLEKLRETTAQTTEVREEMSEAQRAAALKLLKSPGFLDTLSKHIETIGYVGEDRNKKLTYVIASSRKLPKPLSAIVRSQSGAGKSYLMECVAELMPPEDVHFFSRLTPQALYYLERDALQHKLLIVDERNGSEESEYPIRTLQTRKVLKLAVPVKDPNSGRIKTETLEILGPISYMESTTSHKVNPENENRCFELYLDESDAQTRAIFAAQRKSRTLEGWKIERLKEKVRQLHHHAQRLLRPLKVIIPYVDLLEFPQSWLRGRRDHDRFLSLIEGIAFLHQYQRHIGEDNGQEYIEASIEDYAHAYDLAQTVFANTLGDLPKPVMDLLAQIRKMKKAEFTRRDVREFTKLPDHLVKRQMRTLEELEYVSVARAPSGGSFRYRLFSMEESSPALSGLTPPDELRQKLPVRLGPEQAGHDRNKAPVPL